jgi:uncharacterized membrane protein YhaH (DUF805 family)
VRHWPRYWGTLSGMSDRVRIQLFWLAAASWSIVWVVQLVRVTILGDSMYAGSMAMIAIVTFGLFILATAWSKDAREEAKSKRVDARRSAKP